MNPQRVQWLGSVMSVVIYGVMAFIVVKVAPVPLSVSLQQPLVATFYGVAVAAYVAAFLATRRAAPAVRLLMLDAVAILGLVAAYLVHDARIYLAPALLALIGMFRSFPKNEAR